MRKKLLILAVITLAFILRIFMLDRNPPSLYWDETSLGYNAYTIATSLKDEHGEFLPLARFIAFGDYKPPGYIYSTVPSIIIFGLNEFAVRLPSMLAGFLMILVTYFLVKELFKNEIVALLSSFFLAVSPWALQFSRVAFEANLAAFFNLSAIYSFILSRKHRWAIILSVIFFILSFYTFNANRIIAPLLFIGLSIIYRKNLMSNKKWLAVGLLIAFIMLTPSISYLQSRESKLRFQEVSIFNNLAPVKIANERLALDENSWWANIIHNRRVLFSIDFLKHYFDNFTGRFLFTHGDVNPRLSVQDMGQLYLWDLPFLLTGVFLLIKKREKALFVLGLWMLIAPIPAATARETPHALRIASILPTYQIIIAYGLYHLIHRLKENFYSTSTPSRSRFATPGRWPNGLLLGGFKAIIVAFICFLLSANIFYYLHHYYIHFPVVWSGEWQYGYKEVVNFVLEKEKNYDQIFVTNSLGRPYIYFAFYKPYPLSEFLPQRQANRDWFGFWDVKALGKIKFNFEDLPLASGRILVITTPNNVPSGFRELNRVKNLAGDDVFVIGEKI